MAHLEPLSASATPSLKDDFAVFTAILGFVPNSLLTMQRRPEIVKGFTALTRAVMSDNGSVDPGFKRLLAHFASRASGCQYCEPHALVAAGINGIPDEKVKAIWEYRTSPLYSKAERVALDFALAAGSVPNAVTAAMMEEMKAYWDEGDIVEILAAISLYGFLNRWNDSMATELESAPTELGRRVLSQGGWTGGKHVSKT